MLAFYFIGKKVDYSLASRFLFVLLVIINILIITSFLNTYGLNITAFASMRLGIASEETNIEYMNPISIGVYSSFLILLILYKKRFKLIYLFFIIIASFNLLVSASQGPLISLIAVILLYFFAKKPRLNVKFIFFLIVVIFAISLMYSSGIINDFFIFQRLSSIDQNASSNERISFLKSALNQIEENVIFGTHYYVLEDKSSPHNIFIDIILTTGLFGLGLIIYPLFIFLKVIFSNILHNPIIAISFFYFCMAQFSGYVYGLLDFWPLMGLLLAYHLNPNSGQTDNKIILNQ
jgi:O-antigen ligase